MFDDDTQLELRYALPLAMRAPSRAPGYNPQIPTGGHYEPHISPFLTASALIFGFFLPKEEAVAQTAKKLVGTWTLVPVMLEPDSKNTDFLVPIRRAN